MEAIIGIDVGTSAIKCSAILPDGTSYNVRCDTPALKEINTNNQEIIFIPNEIWQCVLNLILPITDYFQNLVISVVCQAPSLCFWNDNGGSVGISYLSYYGDPTQNNRSQRQGKTAKRLAFADRIIESRQIKYISGLTGYIVYMLTGKLTLDSITSWEIGIESFEDMSEMRNSMSSYVFPEILPPLHQIPMNCLNMLSSKGKVLVGATDSAILPISVVPEFSDYYVYLGTWGSLLKSQISCADSYKKYYHTGVLNNWLISISDFISKVDQNSNELDVLFDKVSKLTEIHSKIAICGGLTKTKRDYIQHLCITFLNDREVLFVSEKEGALGACRLAEMSICGVKK